MRRETQHLLLCLLGGMLIRICVDDIYLRYVRPGHRWLLIAAGAVAVALALAAMRQDARTRVGAMTGTPATDHDHEHGGAERNAPWLLLAPVLVLMLVSPPALGADAVVRAGPATVVNSGDVFPPLPAGEVSLTVAEFVQRAAWDTDGSLDGRAVVLTGFAVRRGDAVELARLTIFCCAADVRANRVRLVGGDQAVGAVAADTWLRVRGTLVSASSGPDTQYVPALTVAEVETVPAPPDPYEY